MAKRSKTQKAKASAARKAKKEERAIEAEQVTETSEKSEGETESQKDTGKKFSLKKSEKTDTAIKKQETESKKATKSSKKSEEKPKKVHFKFLKEVRAELKRVTWPTKADVMRWTGVVAVALVFFGVFVAVLDNLIITPLLVLLSGADPATIDWGSVFTGGDFNTSGNEGADASNVAANTGTETGVDAGSDVSADTTGTEATPDVEGTADEGESNGGQE